jgi:anti-sigma B factor antagonist
MWVRSPFSRWGEAEGYVTRPVGIFPPAMAEFEIERVDDTVQVHLKLKGDLDLYTAPTFDDALVAVEGEKWPTIVLDLRELEFLDSMALRLIMRTDARAKQDGRRLVLVRGPEFIDRVLELSGLRDHLTLVDEPPVAPAA